MAPSAPLQARCDDVVAYVADAAPLLPPEAFFCLSRWAHAGVTLSGLAEASDGALLRLVIQTALPGARACGSLACAHRFRL